jgi:glycerophosphoryl diester phosphodiesterase
MFDRATFLRPIAHRGLHDAARGIIENTAPAFAAAIGRGYAIECDVRPAADGLPVVFHDETLSAMQIKALRYRGQDAGVQTLEEFLEQVAGKVPVYVEVKSEWEPPQIAFLSQIARSALDYHGPIALMSFDPDIMTVLRELAPQIPRGIVSGGYVDAHGETWWRDKIDDARAKRLANLLESGSAGPAFYAYHVASLPCEPVRFVRETLGLPVLTWTVRTPHDLEVAQSYADAPIFEGITVPL